MAAVSLLAGPSGARKSVPSEPSFDVQARVIAAIAEWSADDRSDELDKVFARSWEPMGSAWTHVGHIDLWHIEEMIALPPKPPVDIAAEEYCTCLRYWASLGWPEHVRAALVSALYGEKQVKDQAELILAKKAPSDNRGSHSGDGGGLEDLMCVVAGMSSCHGWGRQKPTEVEIREAIQRVSSLRAIRVKDPNEPARRLHYTGSFSPTMCDEAEFWLSVPVYDGGDESGDSDESGSPDDERDASDYTITLVVVNVTTD